MGLVARCPERRFCWSGRRCRSLKGFGEDVAVAGGEGDAAEGGEGWGDVGGGGGLEGLAGVDGGAHQEGRNVLIIVVGHAVAGAVGTLLSDWCVVQEPVRFWQDE